MLKSLFLGVAAGRVKLAKGYFLGCTLNCMVYNQREERKMGKIMTCHQCDGSSGERERENVGPLGL